MGYLDLFKNVEEKPKDIKNVETFQNVWKRDYKHLSCVFDSSTVYSCSRPMKRLTKAYRK